MALPIWNIAVQTEGRARLNVASYASEVSDPLLRRAVELNAFEEGRHILFFVNWAAWHRRTMPIWRRPISVGELLETCVIGRVQGS